MTKKIALQIEGSNRKGTIPYSYEISYKILQAKGGVNFPLKLINLHQNFTNLLGETPDTSCFHFGLLQSTH